MIRYSANINMAFREYPFYERFQRAAALGFAAVEFASPFTYDVEEIVQAVKKASVRVVQFNVLDGDVAAGERGFASHADRREQWRAEMLRGIEFGRRLGVRQVNSLAGRVIPGLDRQAQLECLVDNCRWAVPHLEKAGFPMLLEALNPYDNPGYLLTRSRDVLDVLERVGSPWVKFQCDVYHMQRVEGELVRTIRANIAQIGHIQIADNPGRHQPGTGEINYRFVLQAIDEAGYTGYVGLEYIPLGSTEESFNWLPFDKRVESTAADLKL